MGTHKENVDAASSPTVGWVLFGKLTSRSTTADSAAEAAEAAEAAGDSGAGLGACDGAAVAGGAVGVGLGSAFEGDGSGVVAGLGVTEGVGGTVGLGAYGGEAMVGVHFTRVGLGVGLPLGVAGARLSDGEPVGDGDGDGEGESLALDVAVGAGVAAATMAVALGLLVGLGASVSTRPAVVPANAMIASPTRAAVSTIERWVVRSSSNAVQADASLVLMTALPGYGCG
jgi:hypothetical protein